MIDKKFEDKKISNMGEVKGREQNQDTTLLNIDNFVHDFFIAQFTAKTYQLSIVAGS